MLRLSLSIMFFGDRYDRCHRGGENIFCWRMPASETANDGLSILQRLFDIFILVL